MLYRSYRELVQYALVAGVLAAAGYAQQAGNPVIAATTAAPATLPAAQVAQHLTVSGNVILAADRTPLPNTPVCLVMAMEQGISQKLVAKGITDANGQFRFADALTWDPNNRKGDRQLAQRYYVLANSQQHGFSFAIVLQGDRTDNITVRLVKPLVSTIKVVDVDGKPLPGAIVMYSGGDIAEEDAPAMDSDHRWSAFQRGLDIISGTTDARGEIRLSGLYDGSSYIAHKAGYIRSAGNATGTGTITLMRSTRLTGTVTYEDGKPAPGVKVKGTYRDDKTYWNEQAITDAAGRYVIDDAPTVTPDDPNSPFVDQTSVEITVEDPRPDSAHVAKATTRPSVGTAAQLDIRFPKACVLAGRIVDDRTGKPLQGIQLRLYAASEDRRSSAPSRTLTSNDQGQFKAVIPPGSHVFLMWQDSPSGDYVIDRQWLDEQPEMYAYQPFESEKMTEDKTDLELKLRLWDVQPLTGVVTDSSGKPSANTTIYLSTYVPPVKTAADGTFTLKCAPKDRDFELCVLTDDKNQACLTKLPKGTSQATLQLTPTILCEGIVKTPAGLPADHLKFSLDLELNGQAHPLIREEQQTDAKGTFIANNLIPGAKYNISWAAENEANRDYDSGTAKLDLASLKDGQPIQFTARKYVNALMGQVVGPDGKPVAGAKITLIQAKDLVPQDIRGSSAQTTSDKDGQFTIGRLADGQITVKASAAGLKSGTVQTSTDNVDAKISLRPMTDPSIYRAKVTDPQGNPVEGVPVTMVAMHMDRQGKMSHGTSVTKTDPAGIATFPGPATAPTTQPLQYSRTMMICDADGYDIAFSPPVEQGEDIDTQLTLLKSDKHWQGKVVDDKGKPIAGASVHVVAHRYGDSDYVTLESFGETPLTGMASVTDAEGRFTLSRLGRDCWVNVNVTASGMKTVNAYFDPDGDARSECKVLTMVKGASLRGRVVLKSTGALLAPQNDTGSHVMIMKANGAYGASAQLKPDGTFSSDDLEEGIYSAQFVSTDPALRRYVLRKPIPVATKTGQTTDLTLELDEGIPLKGTFISLPSERPANMRTNMPQDQIGWVSATRAGERNYAAYGTIDKAGQWIMYLPGNGKYNIKYVVVLEGGGGQQSAGIIEVKDNQPPADMTIEFKAAK